MEDGVDISLGSEEMGGDRLGPRSTAWLGQEGQALPPFSSSASRRPRRNAKQGRPGQAASPQGVRQQRYPVPTEVELSGQRQASSVSVQFSSVQGGIYALGKAHMRSTPSLRSVSTAVESKAEAGSVSTESQSTTLPCPYCSITQGPSK